MSKLNEPPAPATMGTLEIETELAEQTRAMNAAHTAYLAHANRVNALRVEAYRRMVMPPTGAA